MKKKELLARRVKGVINDALFSVGLFYKGNGTFESRKGVRIKLSLEVLDEGQPDKEEFDAKITQWQEEEQNAEDRTKAGN